MHTKLTSMPTLRAETRLAGANNVEEVVNDFENIVDFRVIRGGGVE